MRLMKKTILLLFLFFYGVNLFAQENESVRFEFIPAGLHILPLKANYQEARVGVLYYSDNGDLKVDMGNNIDVIAFHFPKINGKLTVGAEFMAYALSTSYQGNRLQIDAVDGFFGGNISFSKKFSSDRFMAKLRFIHNSAHLVDGHYQLDSLQWMNGDQPIPFTRNFFELQIAHQFYLPFGSIKFYGAVSYSTLVRPHDLERLSAFFGYELAYGVGKVFEKDANLFVAQQLTGIGSPRYIMNNNMMGGIKFGDWDGKGIVLYLSYYIGANPLSEYYYERVERFGAGFFLDFF